MSAFYQLEFEKPLVDLEQAIEAADSRLKQEPESSPAAAQIQAELSGLQTQHKAQLTEIYSRLTPWDTVRVARHPSRPQTRDYIGLITRDFAELSGDRRYGDDPAIVTGFARIGPLKVMLVGHQKGKQTAEKIACHFGCAHPEGYRKALAKMKLAEKYGIPIVTLVDTPGAYPGLGAEQRGQAEAIAVNMLEMSRLRTPIVSVVIGEGGSGGALGIAVADKVAMLRYSWYSVISPEGCAAILWKEANEQTNTAAAKSLRLTAADNLHLGIVDEVIEEPPGAAHRDPKATAAAIQSWIVTRLQELRQLDIDTLLEARYQRYRKMGSYLEAVPAPDMADAPIEG
jgi:acetyl-CoA carboxylase carboxyl transferase subunit alpha